MKHERATEEIRELASLYALGSLTQHEARSFEIHMREGCSVCESELRKFARTIAEMGFAAEEVQAPDYIRDLLLARIEREPESDVMQGPTKESEPSPNELAPAVALPHSKGKQWSILAWVLAAGLVILAIASWYLWKTSQETNKQLQAKLAAARMDVEELEKQISSQIGKSAEMQQILSIVHKPEARIARLIGQAATPEFAGAILWDTKENECLAIGSFLPTPQGKVYQLWFFSAAAKIPVGLLQTSAGGRVFTTLRVPQEAAGATAVVVTLEPDNGSQFPTAPYCAAGRID